MSYGIDDVPPWYLCVLLGFQHYLTMFGATIAIPIILSPALCVASDTLATSEIMGTIFFVSGVATLLQTTFGCRLPIVQGGTFSFLAPTFSILALDKWRCPSNMKTAEEILHLVNTTANATRYDFVEIGSANHTEIWQMRMREIQGAIAVASIFQVFIGFSGIMGLLLRFIGPIAITPTIALVGLSLFQVSASFAEHNWWIALGTIFLVALFSQYLRNTNISCAGYSKSKGCTITGYPIFRLFPVIISIITIWIICAILTVAGVFPETPGEWSYGARTDVRIDVLYKAAWFRFPYPFQWGTPTVSTASVFGMLAGVLASMIESVGDYYACARLAGAPPPPTHAINRGIGVEGLGCIIAGIWGSGNGTTSYSENIGALCITKVGSRRVIQFGAVIIILFSVIGKFGALFVTIPDPIIGGVFLVMFGMITAVGISNLQFVDMNSSRNLFIVGFSLFFGLSLPNWMATHSAYINTGSEVADQIISVLLSTSMFVGGAIAFILDNTIPGTDEERGIVTWNKLRVKATSHRTESENLVEPYDMPCCMGLIKKVACFKYVPFCPTFNNFRCTSDNNSENDVEIQMSKIDNEVVSQKL